MTARRASYAERRERADARRAERGAEDDPAIVLDAAAAFLAVRPRSIDETRRRLARLGYRAQFVDIVIDRLMTFGYLDDHAFARSWVESRDRARPRGEVALRRELTLKGVDREVISAVLAERDGKVDEARHAHEPDDPESASPAMGDQSADDQAARRLIGRRSASLAREADPRRRRQRIYALLARNGFAPDVCARVSAESATALDADALEGSLDDV